jgi:hypothetical protein
MFGKVGCSRRAQQGLCSGRLRLSVCEVQETNWWLVDAKFRLRGHQPHYTNEDEVQWNLFAEGYVCSGLRAGALIQFCSKGGLFP